MSEGLKNCQLESVFHNEKFNQKSEFYDPQKEYKVNVEAPEIKEKIDYAKDRYREFMEKFYNKLDLSNQESINEAYEEAEKIGILKEAQEIRELLFGKDIHFYGVSYLWDKCKGHCTYCPGSVEKKKKAEKEGEKYPPRKLEPDQALQDTLAVMDDGHTHICYLTGGTP